MKTIFAIPLPENLHILNGGEEELQILANLPFRPQIMDLIVPANLLFGADELVPNEILAHFIDGMEFLVTETAILKDENGEFYIECYCEPSFKFEEGEGVDFYMGEN
jgi:hypothetical protein